MSAAFDNKPVRTMGESEKKGNIILRVAIGIAALLIFLMTYTGLFNTNLHVWFKNGGMFVHVLGFFLFVFAVAWPWLTDKVVPATMSKIPPAGLSLLAAFLIPVVASGFNMSL
jgi:hypothetical protein